MGCGASAASQGTDHVGNPCTAEADATEPPESSKVGMPAPRSVLTLNLVVTEVLPADPGQQDALVRRCMRRAQFKHFFVSGDAFESVYLCGETIGEGGFGTVKKATHKALGIPRAVKCLQKSEVNDELIRNELEALMALDHPHIVKLVEYFNQGDKLYLVFELCEGPSLLDVIRKSPEGRLSNYDAAKSLRHMLKALQCCHAQHRGHYDVKPENFMFSSPDLSNLVMIDLGLSGGFDVHRRRNNKIRGSESYMAPEFWDGVYGPEGDIWGLGVVLFTMLTGQNFLPNVPRATTRHEAAARQFIRGRLDYAAETYGLSETAVDLMGAMLQHDRHGRPTLREALNHAFNRDSYDRDRDASHDSAAFQEAQRLRERLPGIFRAVAFEPRLKRLARLVMAHIGPVCVAERWVFRFLDKHGCGELSLSTLEYSFQRRNVPIPNDLESLFQAIDMNQSGYIGFWQFLAATLPYRLRNDKDLCEAAFHALDANDDGILDAADLEAVLGHEKDSEACCSALAEVSETGRMTVVTFQEFMAG
mmetsp:Transcript_39356/g.75455  ORF Transcript_39356/g.75455 Transcript_39356/m.75455 type:complete len:533 (+) Transcript_39356:138-1736(+)|eukprot:CAMPEP_0172755386 /NCGR_PEP_ID=MMETSP1074-20121228/159754_1 /TAXON_ID=2916 /ORGANISM="Ceratium fusus, Strain PA161109" /LENGTH=532 /DNA_ID=CAMNT_0013588465 /DNA_START=52 /DNA_END=1647 /DNA_ORIENTATION=+